MIGRLLRAPSWRFLVLGGALWLVRPLVLPSPPAEITVTDADLVRMRHARGGASVGVPDDAALLAQAVDEELLHREAISRGLDRTQPVVRDRLARLARFVGTQPIEDEDALADAARALGLDRRDLVVRRHLIGIMRLALASLEAADMPDDAALAAWWARHADELREPPRVRLSHVYLRREDERVAATLLERLRATTTSPTEAPALGRPFAQGAHHGPVPLASLARVFGDDFARALDDLPVATWSGPIRSAYGLHLVWVHERLPGRVPPLDEVRGRVTHAVLAERRDARARERLAALRSRYAVRVEPARGAGGPGS